MATETRTSEQLRGSIAASARLARFLESKEWQRDDERDLAETLHWNMNRELDVLEQRGDLAG